ncbi:hypothetical protein A8C56_05450 [Niabella ginsenosidivorans]|uniref:Uncharacterized protein n=1 Tax=Niabella ginsenosidivorans TaxID=1176587 RepID=A0A1A9I0A7_9BACT|nr:hypothetical protein A8C56_05450 [Niabella ginsenosidivorans]
MTIKKIAIPISLNATPLFEAHHDSCFGNLTVIFNGNKYKCFQDCLRLIVLFDHPLHPEVLESSAQTIMILKLFSLIHTKKTTYRIPVNSVFLLLRQWL